MIYNKLNQKVESVLKRSFVLILFMVISVNSFGQRSVIDKLYDKYSGKQGITSVYISEFMFKLIAAMDPDDKEFKTLVSELKGIKILSNDGGRYYDFFVDNIINNIPLAEYQQLMEVKEESSIVRILVKEKNGKIQELIILTDDEGNDASLIALQGNIDLQSLSKLSKISGLEELENIELEEK